MSLGNCKWKSPHKYEKELQVKRLIIPTVGENVETTRTLSATGGDENGAATLENRLIAS